MKTMHRQLRKTTLLVVLLTALLPLSQLTIAASAQEEDPDVEEGPENPPPPVPEIPEYETENQTTEIEEDDDAKQAWIDQTAGLFGVGFALGNPSGLTGKIWITPAHGMQFGLGAGPGGNHARFSIDYLYHWRFVDVPDDVFSLPFYVGLGVSAGFVFADPSLQGAVDADGNPLDDDRTDIGVRIPIGTSVIVGDLRVELAMEVAPNIVFYEEFVVFVDGGLAVRYYF